MGGKNRRYNAKKDWGERIISKCHPAFVNPESGFIWCYYCGREWHLHRLKSHQEESHFACPTGCKSKPRHRNIRMLIEHYEKVHKRPLLTVPNAIIGRRDPKVDVVLTLGVPPKAIEERENARIAATQQRQDYPEDEGSSNFNSDKDNWSDKECSKYHADTSQVGNSTLIQATERQTANHSPSFHSTNTEGHSNSQFESEAIAAHVREDNRPKAFRFRHGLDGFSVEERRAKLSKYQSTAGWATKVVNALEILELLRHSVQNKCPPTLDDKKEEVRFDKDGVTLKYSSMTAWYSSSKKAFYTIHTLAFFLYHFCFCKSSPLEYITAAKKANAQTVSSVDRQQIRQYLLGETVSVPKSGGLPRPSVAGIIERPESSTIESECHHSDPVLYKNDVEMLPCHKSDEAVAVSPQQDDAHDSFSLKSATTTTEWNKNENEQVIGFVEESSPSHYKNDIVEMDVEKELEDQRTEENEVSVVNSGALPASSNASLPHHPHDTMKPAGVVVHENNKSNSRYDVPEVNTKSETHSATHRTLFRQKKKKETKNEDIQNYVECTTAVLSPNGDDDLKEDGSSVVSINQNVKYDNGNHVSSSAAASSSSSRGDGAETRKREVCQKWSSSSASSEKRLKQQQPRASDYTLQMIVDIIFEIEQEAEENPGIRRHMAACKNVSKRHGLDNTTVTSWWSARDMIIQQSSTMNTKIVSPSSDTLSSKATPCIAAPLPHTSQNHIIMTKQDLEDNFGSMTSSTTQSCLKSDDAYSSSCDSKELPSSYACAVINERDAPPTPVHLIIKESSLPIDPIIQEATRPPILECNNDKVSSSNNDNHAASSSSSVNSSTEEKNEDEGGGEMMDIGSATQPDIFCRSSIKFPYEASRVVQEKEEISASGVITLPVVIEEDEKESVRQLATVTEVGEVESPLPFLSAYKEKNVEPHSITVGSAVYRSLTEKNEDTGCCSSESNNYTHNERKKMLKQWDQAKRVQKDSTAEAFAEAYGIPFNQFQLWLSERKEKKKRNRFHHHHQKPKEEVKVDPIHEDEWSASKLLDALDEEYSNQVQKHIFSKLLNGETVSVVRAFKVANTLCPNFLGSYNPPEGCICNLSKTHWFYQRAKRWYRAFEKKYAMPSDECCGATTTVGPSTSTIMESSVLVKTTSPRPTASMDNLEKDLLVNLDEGVVDTSLKYTADDI